MGILSGSYSPVAKSTSIVISGSGEKGTKRNASRKGKCWKGSIYRVRGSGFRVVSKNQNQRRETSAEGLGPSSSYLEKSLHGVRMM